MEVIFDGVADHPAGDCRRSAVLIEACPVGEPSYVLPTNRDKVGLRGDSPNPTGMGNQNDHDAVRRRLREFPDQPI